MQQVRPNTTTNPIGQSGGFRCTWSLCKISCAIKLSISGVIVALLLICAGCTDSVQDLVARTRSAATADEWRAWASQVVERYKTNSTPLARSEWPGFVSRTANGNRRSWQVILSHGDEVTNSTTLVMLVTIGGFESTGIVIGPPSYVEVAPLHISQISTQVYPGIYVRQTH